MQFATKVHQSRYFSTTNICWIQLMIQRYRNFAQYTWKGHSVLEECFPQNKCFWSCFERRNTLFVSHWLEEISDNFLKPCFAKCHNTVVLRSISPVIEHFSRAKRSWPQRKGRNWVLQKMHDNNDKSCWQKKRLRSVGWSEKDDPIVRQRSGWRNSIP